MYTIYNRMYGDGSRYISTKKLFRFMILIGVLTPWIIEGISNPINLLQPVTLMKGLIISAVILGVGSLGLNISLSRIERYDRLSARTIEDRDNLYELKKFTDGLINSSGVQINIINEFYDIEFGNNEALKTFGMVEGKKCHEVFFKSKTPCKDCKMQKAIKTGVVKSDINTWVNGTVQESLFIPFENIDRSISVIGIHRDVTEHVAIEKEMEFVKDLNENIIKNSPFAILSLGKEGDITSCNPRFLELINEPSKERLLEKVFKSREFFGNLGLTDRMQKAFTGQPFSAFGIKSKLKDHEIVFNVRCTVMKDPKGSIEGLLVIIEDDTERYQLREKNKDSFVKLQSAYGELKILSRVRDDIIANVSHEIRTPVTICSFSIDLAMEEEGSEQRSLLNLAKDAVLRLSDKVGDLVTISEIQKGSFKLQKKRSDLGAIVNRVGRCYEKKIDEMKLDLDIKIEKDLPMVDVDEGSIEKAIGNLIDNAIKFNLEGGRISISTRKKADLIEVRISDTGVGIKDDHRENIFKRFFQVDGSSTRSYGGTGMGLAVAKEIIESHGGQIFVKSEINGGSEFTFFLPLMPNSHSLS